MARPAPSRGAQIVVALAALLLGWLVVTTATWNLKSGADGDSGPGAVLPEDPSITFQRAMGTMRSSKGAALPRLLPAVDRAARLNPLDARPLFLHAFAHILQESPQSQIAVLEQARHRNPRLAETRLLLLGIYGQRVRAGDAVREAQALTILMPERHGLMVRLIAGLAGLKGGTEALSRALPSSPIKGDVMLRLAQTGADRIVLERLARPMRGVARDPGERAWIGNLVTTVARRPDPDGARSLWSILYAIDPAAVGRRVTDPDFDQGANPPFGWRFDPGSAGVAQVENGALEVFYYGRSGGSFASQMLMLPSGPYRLTTRASSPDGEAPRDLYWQLTCLAGGEPRLRVRLSDLIAGGSRGGAPFSVPEGSCSVQTLELVARASDMSPQQSARIEQIAISPAGS